MIRLFSIAASCLAIAMCGGCSNRAEMAQSQAKSWADRLDQRTTKTGAYVHHEGEQLPENDPWGTPLRVQYSQGGMTEILEVSSAGSDGRFDTSDDLTELRQSTSLKGLTENVKENVGEIAGKAAYGAAKGAIAGAKDGIKEAFSKDKNKNPPAAAGGLGEKEAIGAGR